MRQKLIHSLGVVGTITLEPVKDLDLNPYTGLFNEGSKHGIVRMSETGFILKNSDAEQLYSPSIGMKFLVDG